MHTDGDGPDHWVTRAEGAVEVARLERAANALALACHPGVVELVAFTLTGLESAELRTVRVAAPPLTALTLPPEEVAGVAAAVATTLADLHERDIVHGALDATHVLVPPASAPRLCGFSGDPTAQPADDIAALGKLIAAQLGSGEPAGRHSLDELRSRRGGTPRLLRQLGQLGQLERLRQPRRLRHWSAEGRSRRADDVQPALREIARRATDDDPKRRPGASELAAIIRQRVPSARLPVAMSSSGQIREPFAHWGTARAMRHRLMLLAGAAAALGVAALVLGAVLPRPGPRPEVEPAPAATTTTHPDVAVRVWPDGEQDCESVDTPLRGDVDGDGCDDPIAFADGVLVADSVRLAVGSADDLAATGDWHCTGRPTLVLFRARSASVWHFPRWPAAREHVVGRLVAGELDATTLASRRAGAGCDELHVGLADGSAIMLDIPPPEAEA